MQAAMQVTLYRPQRSADRLKVQRDSTLRRPNGKPVDVWMEDLSATGCRIHTKVLLDLDEELMIGLPGVGVRRARVIWAERNEAGLEFRHPISVLDVEEARTAEPVSTVDFRSLVPPSTADVPNSQTLQFSARKRLFTILIAAIAAWMLVLAMGWWVIS